MTLTLHLPVGAKHDLVSIHQHVFAAQSSRDGPEGELEACATHRPHPDVLRNIDQTKTWRLARRNATAVHHWLAQLTQEARFHIYLLSFYLLSFSPNVVNYIYMFDGMSIPWETTCNHGIASPLYYILWLPR